MMDSNLTGIIIVGMLALIPITIVTVTTLSNMKLKVEQVRANALVRAEEVKAKNQLEIEKLLYNHSGSIGNIRSENKLNDKHFESGDMRQVREKKETNS